MSHLMMGGYALYVWSAYGFAAAMLAIILVTMTKRRKQTRKLLQQWFKQ